MTEGVTRLLEDFYTRLYLHEKHDSAEASRISMIRRIMKELKREIPISLVVNLGSGPQSLEKQLTSGRNRKDKLFLKKFSFVTLDLAKISPKKLLAQKAENVSHVRGNVIRLPFKDTSAGLVVSNLAIDFAPREALKEAYRILASDGRAIFYFHF